MQAMIGLPSGLERVRWKESDFSPQPSRFFENGLEAWLGGSFWVDNAESSEKRTSDSGVNEPSAPTASAAWHSPRRMASTPSWIAVAPEAHAVVSEIGDPSVPK